MACHDTIENDGSGSRRSAKWSNIYSSARTQHNPLTDAIAMRFVRLSLISIFVVLAVNANGAEEAQVDEDSADIDVDNSIVVNVAEKKSGP